MTSICTDYTEAHSRPAEDGTKPGAGPINAHDRKQLEAANVALRNELVTATVVINRAKQRAEDAEADRRFLASVRASIGARPA